MTLEIFLFITTGTFTGLIAGVFFGYAVSVNWALHRLTDSEYIRAMQEVNRVIQNPFFLLTFLGPVILLPLLAFLYGNGTNPTSLRFLLLSAASAIYIIGSFGLTIAGNVPLNNELEKFNEADATKEQVAVARLGFERPWNRLHTIRTIASIAALVLFFAAILLS